MIVSHVWDYSFDTGTNAVDVLVPPARADRQGVRAQAPAHRARRRLCPQGGLTPSVTRSRSGSLPGHGRSSWSA
ncbi:MAG: hypothetical protein R2712_18425 [Vicinamibacterales bacterium]